MNEIRISKITKLDLNEKHIIMEIRTGLLDRWCLGVTNNEKELIDKLQV